jgi:hypothetical protein
VFSNGETRVPTESQKENFVKAFSEKYRKAVKHLIDSTVSIDTLSIVSHFRTCLGLLPKDRPYVLYCPIHGLYDSLKSVMFFELYLLHEVMTKYGLNIIYIFYGAFDRRPSNIIDRQKNELEKIGDFDAIYMDDISYSGTQFLIDTKHLLKIVKNRMFVFFYAMLPKSLERFYSFLLKKQKKIPNIKDLITIYTHKIIVHPFYFLSKLIRGREPLNISYTIQDMCFQSEKKENSSPFQNMENSSPFQNMLYFVIDANMDGDYDRFISMQNRLVRLQLVYIEEKLKETLKIFPERKNLNVA